MAGFEEPTDDVLIPLLVTTLGDPIPFRGSDGMVHVVYELQVFNAAPRDATITSVSTVIEDEVVHRLEGEDLVDRTLVLGPLDPEPQPATTIPTGRTAAVLVDDTYSDTEAVPTTFAHRSRRPSLRSPQECTPSPAR